MEKYIPVLIDAVGEAAIYSQYQILAAYGMGKIDWEDLDEELQDHLRGLKWDREKCGSIAQTMEAELYDRGYIEEADPCRAGMYTSC